MFIYIRLYLSRKSRLSGDSEEKVEHGGIYTLMQV